MRAVRFATSFTVIFTRVVTSPSTLTTQTLRENLLGVKRLLSQKMVDEQKANNLFLNVLKQESAKLAPSLDYKGNHKGASGKIAVVGGSFEYTGAPYFASISALKTGADLVHVFCTHDAAIPIKCYSPELIVHPLLQLDKLEEITTWLQRMDVVLIGCGLGRNTETLNLVKQIIGYVKQLKKPLILDADALYLITEHPAILHGFESDVILTPNRMELARLAGITNPAAIGDDDVVRMVKKNNWSKYITLLVKAANDQVYNAEKKVILTDLGGSGRRCGGQGDILGGCLAVFLNWSMKKEMLENRTFVAAFAACRLTRECNQRAYLEMGRSMMAGDMINQIHSAFNVYFEPPQI